MVSLADFLPAPSQGAPSSFNWNNKDEEGKKKELIVVTKEPPPYGHRRGWMPRSIEDFGAGGAFPEIHVAQYPLNMGRDGGGKGQQKSNALALQLDAEGNVCYDAIAKQGHGKDKVVHSKPQDLLPVDAPNRPDDPDLHRPDDEEIQETTEKTRQALEQLVAGKIAAAMPVKCADKPGAPQYIRYTPSQQGDAYNSGAKQRIIRMVEAQVDPMEPSKFMCNKKIPRGPPSPPVPVLHSPTRKTSVKEQQEWKIPPCVSNWKNAKGYTIPLDKRLAADGRGLQGVHINENFAKLAEALYIADRKAREAVEMRAQLEKKVLEKEKQKKEEALRDLAQKAREDRAGIRRAGDGVAGDVEARERDEIRGERHRERQRDKNIQRAAPDRRSKLERERERDISEKIALGLPGGSKTRSDDVEFDHRLFNQSKGLDSGYGGGEDDTYNVYDKPWRDSATIGNSIYRPRNVGSELFDAENLEKMIKTNKRFVADKEFSGTDHTSSRDGPVQFEKDEDPFDLDTFGLDKFLRAAKDVKESSMSSSSTKRGAADGRDDRERKRRKD